MGWKSMPSGERPEAETELRAYGFGSAVTELRDKVRIQQVVSLAGIPVIVFSDVPPQEARNYAQSLIERAEVVEGAREYPSDWSPASVD